MKLHDVTNQILTKINRSDSLGKNFNISCDFVSKEFNEIDLHSVNKKHKSFTLLVLPKLPHDYSKLFGDNSKGGEK